MTQAATLTEQACETPLIDLLLNVPADARMTYEHSPTHHQMIPVGKLCQQAAATLQGSAALPSEAMIEAMVAAWPDADAHHGIRETCEDLLRAAMRAATPTTPAQDDDAELVKQARDLLPTLRALGYDLMAEIVEKLCSRLSPTPDTDQQGGVPASPSGCQPSASAAKASSLSGIPNACEIPPEGWWCSREVGHGGPCAAREVTPPWYAKLIADLRSPPYWSAEYGPDDARLDISPRHASDALEITVAALQAVKRVALVCEGAPYDLILSYVENALRARPSCGFWRPYPQCDSDGED